MAAEAHRVAAQYRAERDRLIRQLRSEDPRRWSYGALAAGLGCSRELIALVVKRKRWSQESPVSFLAASTCRHPGRPSRA